MNNILLVDDEEGVRFGIRDFLEAHGYEVIEAGDFEEAERQFLAVSPDACIVDYRLRDRDGLDLLQGFKRWDSSIPVIILTAHGSIDLAVRAIKEGAENFLTKPVELSALLVILQRVLENQRTRRKQLAGGRTRMHRVALNPFVGESRAVRELADLAAKVLATEAPILLSGETGVGKGVLARWLHDHGPRAQESLVDVNCAGLSEELLETELFGHERGAFTGAIQRKPGLFEIAHRGTLFLDEVGDVVPNVQPKLLKVVEEKRFRRVGDVQDRYVDVRIISASHQDLGQLVQMRRFRSDLYFRLSAVPLRIPPLRERPEDIPALAQAILREIAAELGRGERALSREALAAVTQYSWPGNIRELRNVLEHATLLCEGSTVARDALRLGGWVQTQAPTQSHLTLQELERQQIETVLREESGRVERAAARLGIPRSSLYQKIKKHGIPSSRI